MKPNKENCEGCPYYRSAGAYPNVHYYCQLADRPVDWADTPLSNLQKCPKVVKQ